MTTNTLMQLLAEITVTDIDYLSLSGNKALSFEYVLANLDKKWGWCALSENPCVTIEDIKAHPELPWNWSRISSNSSITPEIMEDNPDLPWDWSTASGNKNVTLSYMQTHPYRNWSVSEFSSNPNLTSEYVWSNIDFNWNWIAIASNPSFTVDEILDLDPPLSERRLYILMSANTSVRIADVRKRPDKLWFFPSLSLNAGITFEDIMNNMDLPWNWKNIYKNPNVTMADIYNNSHLFDECRKYGILNPNISIDYIHKHIGTKNGSYYLMHNEFTNSDELRFVKQRKIASMWRRHRCRNKLKIIYTSVKYLDTKFPNDLTKLIMIHTLV